MSSRRKPQQARALRTRERLLDAAAALLERDGDRAMTTNAVAAEAGVSIGTLYQYFSNREALIEALLERYRERLTETVMGALAPADGPLDALAESTVEAFYRFYRDEPGYRVVWLSAQASTGVVRAAGDAWGHDFASMVAALIAARAPHVPAEERAVVGHTAVHLVSALLTVAVSRPRRGQRPLVREAKQALVAYLERRLAPPVD